MTDHSKRHLQHQQDPLSVMDAFGYSTTPNLVEQLTTNDTVNGTLTTTPDPYAEPPSLFYFRRIVPGILLAIGLPGNALAAAVMFRAAFRTTSVGIYILALVICDTVFLFSNYSFIFWIINNFGPSTFFLVHNTVLCKLWVYISDVAGFTSSGVLVAMSIERVIVIVAPHLALKICSRRKATIIVISIFGFMMAMHSYVLVIMESVPNRNKNPIRPSRSCFIGSKYNTLVANIVYHLLPFSTYSLFPGLILIVCNSIIICTLWRRPSVASDQPKSKARAAETRRLTALLLAAATAFLFSTFPMTTLVFLENVFKFIRIKNPILSEVYLYVMPLMALNQGTNFIVYCLSGSAFRQEVRKMIGWKKVKCSSSCCRVGSSTKKITVPRRNNDTGSNAPQRYTSTTKSKSSTSTRSDGVYTDSTYL